jgi:hypothetical protein
MPNLLSHASVLIYLVCSAFKTSAYEQSLVSRFAISQGSGSETLKTLSLTLGSATLLPIVMIGSVLVSLSSCPSHSPADLGLS